MPYKNKEDKRNWAREYARTWRAKNPGRASASVLQSRDPKKHAARNLVAYYKKTGKLIPQPCEVCGKSEVQAHHDDYSKPLDVRWLCRLHHTEAHR